MKRFCDLIVIFAVMLLMFCFAGRFAAGGNIDPDSNGASYSYVENIGWLNLNASSGGGVTVTDTLITGYIWSENTGWISLSCLDSGTCGLLNFGVLNDGAGHLSGYGWGESIGWINFAPSTLSGGGVAIDSCGYFSGNAWSENAGWVNFDVSGRVRTSWDGTAPSTSSTIAGDNTTKDITLIASDCNSGIRETHYLLNNNPEVIVPVSTALPKVDSFTTTLNVSSEGNHILNYFSADNLGNIEAPHTLTFYIDRTAPVITVTNPASNGTYYVGSQVYANYMVDDPVSGVANSGGTVPDGGLLDTSTAGMHTITVYAVDTAGNSVSNTITYQVIPFGNTDPDNEGYHFAYSENTGWINFQPSSDNNVKVTESRLTGSARGENTGWLNMNPANGGVMNDGTGTLSGDAWGENTGWVRFNPAGGGVSIDSCGYFTGKAWGENIGWINFDVPSKIRTAWEKTPPCNITDCPCVSFL